MKTDIHIGDCLATLPLLPAGSVNTCITSPPYFGLRDYGTASWVGGDENCDHQRPNRNAETTTMTGGTATLEARHFYHGQCGLCGAMREDRQLGMEERPEEFVEKMVEVFRQVHRVLRDDGTLWLNLGDSYAGSGAGSGGGHLANRHGQHEGVKRPPVPSGCKPKDLIGIPWRVAFALQADGWYLRSDIIWNKRNPMPESVTDRPTKAHEYLFLLSKSPRYYYDAEAVKEKTVSDGPRIDNELFNEPDQLRDAGIVRCGQHNERNKRSVWTLSTKPFPGAHFATFPPALVEPCILAGTSEKGYCSSCGSPWIRVVEHGEPDKIATRGEQSWTAGAALGGAAQQDGPLPQRKTTTTGWRSSCECTENTPAPGVCLDPFGGAGTVALVASRLQRDAVLCELNPEFAELSKRRIYEDAPLFNQVDTRRTDNER